MKTPTVHMNGTAATDLLEGYLEAAQALRIAIEKVGMAGPNARDYYVQEPGAFEVARSEHEARLDALIKVLRDMGTLSEAVAERL